MRDHSDISFVTSSAFSMGNPKPNEAVEHMPARPKTTSDMILPQHVTNDLTDGPQLPDITFASPLMQQLVRKTAVRRRSRKRQQKSTQHEDQTLKLNSKAVIAVTEKSGQRFGCGTLIVDDANKVVTSKSGNPSPVNLLQQTLRYPKEAAYLRYSWILLEKLDMTEWENEFCGNADMIPYLAALHPKCREFDLHGMPIRMELVRNLAVYFGHTLQALNLCCCPGKLIDDTMIKLISVRFVALQKLQVVCGGVFALSYCAL